MWESKNLRTILRINNAVPHFFADGIFVYSTKNKIFFISDLQKPKPQFIAEIPWMSLQHLSHFRFLDRYFKNSILFVHKTRSNGYLAGTGHGWWHIDQLGNVHAVSHFSGTRPMHRGLCESFSGWVYVAEYISNPQRKEVHIYRTRDLALFEIAWTFEKKSIRHVHALISDPALPNRIWVLTGDLDHESCFFYTDDDFSTLKCFYKKGQISRATDLIIRCDDLYWGMDSPLETSYLIHGNKKDPNRIDRVCELSGPAYYLCQNENSNIYVGTTVEPGPGVKDKFARIIKIDAAHNCLELLKRRADIFPQYGIFYFPKGILPRNILIYSQRALYPYEGCLTIAEDHS